MFDPEAQHDLLSELSAASYLEALVKYLPGCRWFGGKERVLENLSVSDVLVASDSDSGFLALLECRYGSGESELYLLALAPSAADLPPAPLPPISGRRVVDAFERPGLARVLLRVAAGDTTLRGLRGEVAGSPLATLARIPRARRDGWTPAPLHSDQSNSSLRCDDDALLKIYRRLEAGVHPDVEISRFLTQKAFPHTPPLFGSLEYRPHDASESIALGTLQRFVPGAVTAWDRLRRRFEHLPGDEQEAEWSSSLTEDARDVELLGRRTAALHTALISGADSPAFLPEPLGAEAFVAWIGELEGEIEAVADLLLKHSSEVPRETQARADAFVSHADALKDHLRVLGSTPPRAFRSRIHGDYHLGQVLRAADDYWIVDFEGEPLRSLAERRRKSSPLRDVAGMVRSFDYLVSDATRGAGDGRSTQQIAEWHATVVPAFLRGYRESCSGKATLPSGDEFERLLALHMIEKSLYEVRYELKYRPEWVEIPLASLTYREQPSQPIELPASFSPDKRLRLRARRNDS